jgi:hypothetical protein
VSAAAACIRHPAGHAIIAYLFIYCLVPAAAACVRHLAAVCCCHCYLSFIICLLLINYLVPAAATCVRHPAGHAIIEFLLYLSFSACSSSVREASCGSMMPVIIVYLIFIYFI